MTCQHRGLVPKAPERREHCFRETIGCRFEHLASPEPSVYSEAAADDGDRRALEPERFLWILWQVALDHLRHFELLAEEVAGWLERGFAGRRQILRSLEDFFFRGPSPQDLDRFGVDGRGLGWLHHHFERASRPGPTRLLRGEIEVFVQGKRKMSMTGRQCRHVRVAAPGREYEEHGEGEKVVMHLP
jgi:hypothetical protein